MEKLLKINIILLFVTSCSFAQNNELNFVYLEDIKIGKLKVFQTIDSVGQVGYYKYVSKKKVISFIGEPDKVDVRNDELMETEIIRMYYGKSYIEFFDHSFGSGINRDNYSLYSVHVNDQKIWLDCGGKMVKVGSESKDFFMKMNDKGVSRVQLKRGFLDEVSDYILEVIFDNKKVVSASLIFD